MNIRARRGLNDFITGAELFNGEHGKFLCRKRLKVLPSLFTLACP